MLGRRLEVRTEKLKDAAARPSVAGRSFRTLDKSRNSKEIRKIIVLTVRVDFHWQRVRVRARQSSLRVASAAPVHVVVVPLVLTLFSLVGESVVACSLKWQIVPGSLRLSLLSACLPEWLGITAISFSQKVIVVLNIWVILPCFCSTQRCITIDIDNYSYVHCSVHKVLNE